MAKFLDNTGLSQVWEKIKALIPTKTSDLTNDSGFLTSYTETDPTVPSWAKNSTKPTYTASEVGALPDSTVIPTISALQIISSGTAIGSVTINGTSTTFYIPDGQWVVICDEGEYEEDTLLPTIQGEEGIIYLVPKPPEMIETAIGEAVIGESTVGKSEYIDETNLYQEWIYVNDQGFERVGERIATDLEVETMLKQIGLLTTVGIVDEAIVDEAIVG